MKPGFNINDKAVVVINDTTIPVLTGEQDLQDYLRTLSSGAAESYVLFERNPGSEFGLRILPNNNTVLYFQVNRALIMPADTVKMIQEFFPQVIDIGQAENRRRYQEAISPQAIGISQSENHVQLRMGEFNKPNYGVNTVFEVLTRPFDELLAMSKQGYQPASGMWKRDVVAPASEVQSVNRIVPKSK